LVAKALGISVSVRSLGDKKPSSITFLKQTYGTKLASTCLFEDIDCITQGSGRCLFHGDTCSLPDAGGVDVVVLGPPCQPCSAMRSNRKEVPPHRHPDFTAIFDKTLNYLRVVKPRGGVMEQARGFAKVLQDGVDDHNVPLPHSWLVRFLQELGALGYSHKVFALNNGCWIEAPRERYSERNSEHPSHNAPWSFLLPFRLKVVV
jgi:hypothetical protein